jgi:hypothetical protein
VALPGSRARWWLTSASLLLALAGPARADDGERPRNTVTANPVRFALLHFQIDYERAVTPGWSLFASPIVFHHATWYPFARAPEMTASGFGVDLGSRYFMVGAAPAGAFVCPMLSIYRGEVRRAGAATLDGYVVSPGVQGGYTHLVGGRWVLSGGGGVSYGFATAEAPDGSARAEHLPHRGLWLNFRLNGGIAF